MFDNIFAAIEKWMRELLSGMVESNLSTMFTAVNQQTSEIAAQVGQTPQGWNSSIFSMIRNISDSVVIPIAGIIITLILCYELISMLTERNNLHDVDTWMFFKYFVKMWIAVYLVSHTFDIAMAVFDIGQSVVNSSSGIRTMWCRRSLKRLCLCRTTAHRTIQVLMEIQPLVAEDAEMAALVQQTIPKMQQLNEQQFKGLELEWYKPEEPNKKTGVAEK